jgi:hypothetical protein
MRGERLDVESQKLQDRFVNVIWRVLQQYPVDKMLDPEFGRSASGFIELNQLVDAVTHDREAAEHPEYRHNNRLTAAFRKFTRAGLAMLGLGAVVNNNALANPVTTADNEFAQKLSGFPALVVSPPAQAGVYDFDGGEGGGDGPEGGPGEDLVELMAGVREIRAIYTTSIEAQDAVDAINRRLFKIGAFQSNQAKYLKKNPSESNSLNLFVRKLEASKTTAESEVTRLQTAEAAAKLDAAKPAPAPATPSIEDQIVESRVEKVLAEINYFKEKISFLKNELRSSTISAANRTTFNSSLKEAEDYLRQLETTILGDAADKNNIKQSEKILFSAQQKKADKLALEQVKTLDQARAAADSLMIPVVGVQKSYTSHESALEAFNNCTARLDELEAFTEATNGSNTLQDRDPLKWSKLVGYISLVKQQKIDAMSAWQRLQATVNNRDAAAVAEN